MAKHPRVRHVVPENRAQEEWLAYLAHVARNASARGAERVRVDWYDSPQMIASQWHSNGVGFWNDCASLAAPLLRAGVLVADEDADPDARPRSSYPFDALLLQPLHLDVARFLALVQVPECPAGEIRGETAEQRDWLASLVRTAWRAGEHEPGPDAPFGGRPWVFWYAELDQLAADHKQGPVSFWDACAPLFDRLVDAGALVPATDADRAEAERRWGTPPRADRIEGYPYDPRMLERWFIVPAQLLRVVPTDSL